MTEVLVTAELVVSAVFVLAAALAAAMLVRRRLIGRDAELTVCVLRRPRHPGRTGLLRLSASELSWYPLFGLTPRARYRWSRALLDVGAPRSPRPERHGLVGLRRPPVQVTCHLRGHPVGEDFDLVLDRDSYTALRAWAEASPPMGWPSY